MAIAWDMFTPWSALAGGALIGIAGGMFVLLNGRIADQRHHRRLAEAGQG